MGQTGPAPILAVSSYPELGGGEILLVDLLTSLARRGFAVELVAFGEGAVAARARERGLTVTVAPPVHLSKPRSVLRGVRALRAATASRRPALVHASNPKAQLLVQAATATTRPARSVQLLDPPAPGDRYAAATRRLRALRFAITPSAQAAWSAALGEKAVELVEPGVDGDALRSRARRGDAAGIWRAAGLDDTKCSERIVMVARLQRYKGTFDFVALADRLRARPETRFLLVGPDEPLEPGERAAVRAQIDTLGLRDCVAVAGPLHDDDLAAVVQDAAVLVHPAHSETFGLVVVEALALGTPVVAYATAGPAHILEHGGGILVPPRDVESLATMTTRVLDEPPARAESARGAAAVAERFGIERMTDGYVAAFVRAAPSVAPPDTRP